MNQTEEVDDSAEAGAADGANDGIGLWRGMEGYRRIKYTSITFICVG